MGLGQCGAGRRDPFVTSLCTSFCRGRVFGMMQPNADIREPSELYFDDAVVGRSYIVRCGSLKKGNGWRWEPEVNVHGLGSAGPWSRMAVELRMITAR